MPQAAVAERRYRPVPVEFEAWVWAAGYEWEGRGPERKLMQLPQEFAATHQLQLLREHSGLFKIFADLDPTPASIKAFADQYGRLLDKARGFSDAAGDSDGEPLSLWISEIALLRLAFELTETPPAKRRAPRLRRRPQPR